MITTRQAIELKSLSSEGDRIALRGVRVRSRLCGMSQRTVVEQMYVNLENRAIEAVYTFPLPDGSAVCGFEVITGDRVLTGAIEETEKAIEKYDDAISQGHGAFMLEADRPDVFTARVGNLKPRQAATIRLTYVAPLERVDKQIRLSLPTTVAPRYASMAGMDPLEGMMDADALNPPQALCVPYGMSLEVDVDLGRTVKGIFSPTHPIRVLDSCSAYTPSPGNPGEGGGEGSSSDHRDISRGQGPHPNPLPEYRARGQGALYSVLLESAMAAMDRDVVLSIELAKEHEPMAEVARGVDGAAYVAVTFVPEFDVDELSEPAPSETVFVLDCSGSMQGQSIAQAIQALSLCLRSLSPGDSFNICRFGSTFEMMSSEPLVYSQHTLAAALSYVGRAVDLGGTEILPALQAIFDTKPTRGSVRNIIVLTDGEVTNEPAVIELARRHRDRNRIFSFGIGSAASSFLVKGLARATRGASEFISGNERIDEKVLRTFSRITSPMVSELEIDWNGADVQTLAEIPPVFDGDVLSVFGRVQGTPPKAVTLKCSVGGAAKSWSVALPPVRENDTGVISTMWARRTIQSLEEVNDVRGTTGRPDLKSRERRMVIELSKQFNLVSSLTSFIAIEHRSLEERNNGRPALRRVPVMLAHGWGGLNEMVGAVGAPCAGAGASLMDAMEDPCLDLLRAAPAPMAKRRARGRLTDAVRSFIGGALPAKPAQAEAPTAPMDDFQKLLSLQSADGWFDRDVPLFAKLLANWQDVRRDIIKSIQTVVPPRPDQALTEDRLAHTVIVLKLLVDQFYDRESLWRRAAQKARRWLASVTTLETAAVQEWIAQTTKAPAKP